MTLIIRDALAGLAYRQGLMGPGSSTGRSAAACKHQGREGGPDAHADGRSMSADTE